MPGMNQTEFLKAMAQTDADFNKAYVSQNKDRGEINAKLGAVEKFQLNQALEKRGGIRFNYAPTQESSVTKKVWLPFYENPTITESRKANYATTKIYLRNEPVRLYTSSEARKFKVDVHYSLIHMAAMLGTEDIMGMFSLDGDETAYRDTIAVAKYIEETVSRDTNSTSTAVSDASLAAQSYERGVTEDGPWGPNRWWKNPSQSSQGSNRWNFALMWVMRNTPQWVNHHKIIQKVINNVRSSVIGTAQMPVKGPPIVELKWGTMYDFTPCIITDYKIQPVENAGYDSKSLTAQRLKISLSLEEMRNINGNQWGNPQIGGDLPGWDSIQQLGSIDPVPTDSVRNADGTVSEDF